MASMERGTETVFTPILEEEEKQPLSQLQIELEQAKETIQQLQNAIERKKEKQDKNENPFRQKDNSQPNSDTLAGASNQSLFPSQKDTHDTKREIDIDQLIS